MTKHWRERYHFLGYQEAERRLPGRFRREGVPLRQSYRRLAKRAAIMVGRYSHAPQLKLAPPRAQVPAH
jgi:hypothetical protein